MAPFARVADGTMTFLKQANHVYAGSVFD